MNVFSSSHLLFSSCFFFIKSIRFFVLYVTAKMVSKMIPFVLFFSPSCHNRCSLSFPQIFVPLDFRDIRNLLCSLKTFAESLKETLLPFRRFSQAILKGRNCTNTDLNVYFVYVWCLCVYKSISHMPLIFVRPYIFFSLHLFPLPHPLFFYFSSSIASSSFAVIAPSLCLQTTQRKQRKNLFFQLLHFHHPRSSFLFRLSSIIIHFCFFSFYSRSLLFPSRFISYTKISLYI